MSDSAKEISKETNVKSACVFVSVCVTEPIFGIYLASLQELSPESVSKGIRCSKNKSKSRHRGEMEIEHKEKNLKKKVMS